MDVVSRLLGLPPRTITTWDQLKDAFIKQYTPPAKVAKVKAAIYSFHQESGEILYAAWNRYKTAAYAAHTLRYATHKSVYAAHTSVYATHRSRFNPKTITPEALESVKAALASSEVEHKAEVKKRAIPRKAAGQAWEDPTLAEWPENDYRLFCGDLGNEVNDDVLSKAFQRFPSFNMAKVVRDKRTGKTKGYGFVSFSNPTDLAGALKEMNGKYVGNRPIKLRKSNWKERTDVEALARQKKHTQRKKQLPKKSVLHK